MARLLPFVDSMMNGGPSNGRFERARRSVMILELIVAVSVPLWLGIEELMRLRRKREHEARVAARKKSRQAALESLLSRTT